MALTKATIPVTCGQAIEVPEENIEMHFLNCWRLGFQISGIKALGPFEENAATRGAGG